MLSRPKAIGGSLLVLAMAAAPIARAETDQQTLVERSRITVEDLKRDKEFGTAKQLLHSARAILIVPRLYKGGFFVGGEGGAGVLLTRQGEGSWSSPAFYDLGSASFGLQIGLEQAEMVLLVMSQKGLDALMQDQFKIGVGAGITVVTLGSGVEGATTAAAGADIVTWSSSSGAYAGITLNGTVIKPAKDDDAAYYGHAVTTKQILAQKAAPQGHGIGLQQALSSVN